MTHRPLGRENILALQARVGHGETSGGSRVGDVTIADLMPEALRQNLSHLIVGEVRGGEAAAMFEAMQAGTKIGSLYIDEVPLGLPTSTNPARQGGPLTPRERRRNPRLQRRGIG
jgi:hypothetical protein